ncbi:hypothetical protein BRARA_D00840 [Brassica rapa]|uniref:Uncharacterized protein n=1 Tax=Brassica campestris TaxID=3711 RepID=A0A397ZJ47_BRACM|nr:hypothetical protein BRARA_D00840 [Brassica rapa]
MTIMTMRLLESLKNSMFKCFGLLVFSSFLVGLLLSVFRFFVSADRLTSLYFVVCLRLVKLQTFIYLFYG